MVEVVVVGRVCVCMCVCVCVCVGGGWRISLVSWKTSTPNSMSWRDGQYDMQLRLFLNLIGYRLFSVQAHR